MQKNFFLTLIFCLISPASHAELRHWQIDPAHSKIAFTATQNNAPAKGEFLHVKGDIAFDVQDPAAGSIHATIPLSGVTTSYPEMADMLKSADWLDIAHTPQATFSSKTIRSTGQSSYDAAGELTIRGVTLPITLHFTLEEYEDRRTTAKGNAEIKRTAYGIGQGDWTKTDIVKDEVEIKVTIVANRK